MAAATVHQLPDPPPVLLAISSLERADYSDAFLIETAETRTPESWARTMLEGRPIPIRLGLIAGWTLLGLRLSDPRSPSTVLGWPIRTSTHDHIVLAARSTLGFRAELVLAKHPDGLQFATVVQQHGPVAPIIWTHLAGMHQRVVRGLLRSASRTEPELR